MNYNQGQYPSGQAYRGSGGYAPNNQFPNQYIPPNNQPNQPARNSLATMAAQNLINNAPQVQGGVIPMYIPTNNAKKVPPVQQQILKIDQVRKDLFAEIRSHFSISQESSQPPNVSAVATLSVPQQNVDVKIILHSDGFPIVPPKIVFEGLGLHPCVESSSNEIKWNQFFQWNAANPSLLELLKSIQNVFTRDPPKQDQIISQLRELMRFPEQQIQQQVREATISQLFPQMQPQQIALLSSQEFEAQLLNFVRCKELVTYLLEINQMNEIMAERIQANAVELEKKAQQIYDQEQNLQRSKEALQMSYHQSQALTERFSKTRILTLLERLKGEIDEQSEKYAEGSEENVDGKQNEQDCLKYLELRKQYHKLENKTIKFEQVM